MSDSRSIAQTSALIIEVSLGMCFLLIFLLQHFYTICFIFAFWSICEDIWVCWIIHIFTNKYPFNHWVRRSIAMLFLFILKIGSDNILPCCSLFSWILDQREWKDLFARNFLMDHVDLALSFISRQFRKFLPIQGIQKPRTYFLLMLIF